MIQSFKQLLLRERSIIFNAKQHTTILGIIEMRLKGISYDDCRSRYGVGNSTANLIMTRYWTKGIPLDVLKQMPGSEVEASFYPPSNVRRKSEDIMPDFEAIYDRNGTEVTITMPKAEILSIGHNVSEESYYSSEDGLIIRNEITTEEQQKAIVEAQDEMKQEILKNKALFFDAESRAKELIENYIRQIGKAMGEEFAVVWQ